MFIVYTLNIMGTSMNMSGKKKISKLIEFRNNYFLLSEPQLSQILNGNNLNFLV